MDAAEKEEVQRAREAYRARTRWVPWLMAGYPIYAALSIGRGLTADVTATAVGAAVGLSAGAASMLVENARPYTPRRARRFAAVGLGVALVSLVIVEAVDEDAIASPALQGALGAMFLLMGPVFALGRRRFFKNDEYALKRIRLGWDFERPWSWLLPQPRERTTSGR